MTNPGDLFSAKHFWGRVLWGMWAFHLFDIPKLQFLWGPFLLETVVGLG